MIIKNEEKIKNCSFDQKNNAGGGERFTKNIRKYC